VKKYLILYTSVLFIIIGVGLVMIYSASSIWAEYKTGNPYYYLLRQGLFFGVGFVGFIIASRIPYQFWLKQANKIFFACLILLILVLIPGIGIVRGGARSWIGIGDFSIQPAEFMKLGLIIFTAKFLSKNKGILNKPIEVKLTNEKNIDLGLIELIEFKDYIEQFIYYRKLRGYTQSQVGQVIGVSGKTYYKYEKRIHKLNDINKIKKIADFLEIEEIKLPEIKNKITNKELKEYLEENNITNSELSRKTKISRRSIIDWFNKETKISDESYKKINDFILNFEREKAGKKQLEEEEEIE